MCKCCGLLSVAVVETMTRAAWVFCFTACSILYGKLKQEGGGWNRSRGQEGMLCTGPGWHCPLHPPHKHAHRLPLWRHSLFPGDSSLCYGERHLNKHNKYIPFPSTLTKQRPLLLICKVHRICILP